MKIKLLLLTISMVLLIAGVWAQPNVFNHNDTLVTYNASLPPVTPAANTMAKWVRTSRVGWNTTRFKSYYWNGMVFRLRFPNGYNPADATKKYPVILFFHGAGERAPVTDNEHQLLWGAQTFENMINANNFNAFMLFPQVSTEAWDYSYYTRINSVLDSLQKYCNADQDRVISMGLSNGGFGALSYAMNFPQRASVIISSSPALIQILTDEQQQNVLHVPIWLASGGLDPNPDTNQVRGFVNSFVEKGGNIRSTYYPNLGHGTWTQQWAEPFLVPYWNAANKANPVILFGKSEFCFDSVSARIGITGGFAQYQWQKDNVDIPGAVSNEITATQLGSYRVHFKRFSSSPWSEWSPIPAVLTPRAPGATPAIKVSGTRSKVLPAPDGSITVPLELTAGHPAYEWRRTSDNVLLSTQHIYEAAPGSYIGLIVGCNRTFSPAFTVISATGTPRPDSAMNVTIARLSPTSIRLNWTDKTTPASDETGFEIYRGATATGPYTLVFITAANIRTFTEQNLPENFNGYYRIRAVNNTGASSLSAQVTLQPSSDNIAPSIPANFKAGYTGHTSIDLDWDNATDNVGVTGYDVYVDNVNKFTTTSSYISVDSLENNRSYSFKIQARDQAGNTSGFSTIVTATATANGLRYRFYEGNWNTLPDFSTLTPVKIGTTPNIDLSVRSAGVNDYYGFVWEGVINIKTPGNYTFETSSDDGSKLYFNEFYSPTAEALVNNDGIHGAILASGTVNIPAAGLYPITMTFFEKYSGESMQVYWTGPGIARQLIPNSAFTETYQLPADVTAPSLPGNFKILYTGRTFTELDWDNSTDNIGVTGYDVYVDSVFRFTTPVSNFSVDSLEPNRSHSFKIKARDLAGNTSAFTTILSSTSAANGLRYRYYEGNWDLLPDFKRLTPVKSGATPNIDISVRTAGVNDYFGFLWEGYINIKTPGNYLFETVSDDGSKLYFNTFYAATANALVNNDGLHGAYPVTGTINVATAGLYPITISFFEKYSGESMQIYWTGPGIPRQLIPNSAFTETFQLPGDAVAPSVPGALRVVNASRTTVDIAWNASTDNIGVTGYDVYVDSVYKYNTTALSITADSLAPNRSHSFKVRARDLAGNTSAFSAIISTVTAANGLKYRYYEGNWDVLPDFNALTPVKTGSTPNIDLSLRTTGVNDYFGFVWDGYINIPTTGNYTFELISDDGSKFYFNSTYSASAAALVNHDGLHGAYPMSASTNITAGLYPIAISFFEKY
ncbi:MAG: PA14 domain-containing protein, partial [Chitinophagaceae bacterium]